VRLRNSILLATLLAVVPPVVVAGWLAYRAALGALDDELGRRLAAVASLVADQFSASGDAGRIARLEPDSERIRARLVERLVVARDATGVRRVRLVDLDMQTLADTDQFEPFAVAFDLGADRTELDATVADRLPRASVLFTAADGTILKRGWAVVWHEERPVAAVAVEASAGFFDLLARYRTAMAGLGATALALIALASFWVARRVSEPVTRLEAAAARIGRGELASAVEPVGSGEIASLARALEQMRTRLASRDEELQLMLAGIAHEVRNPLGGIELHLGLLEEELGGAEAPDALRRIRRELDHLGAVVNSFLAFAREQPSRREVVEARALVEPVLACVRAGSDARIDLEIEPGARTLTVDPELARAAVQNVVQNAAQAAPRGVVAVSVRAEGDGVCIEVADDGPGMSADVLRQAFRPFYTTRARGTGLGLALVRKTMERHDGRVTIDSEPGAGTRVRLHFPTRVPDPQGEPAASGDRAADEAMEMIG
jgi:signal transduction histidine kinase